MAKLTIVDSGVLYRNPFPGHQAVIAFGPFILPLSERELICSFKCGQAMYSRDGNIHLLRSTDGGKTWDHEGPVRDRAQDERHYQYALAPMTRLRDGSLLLAGCRADRTDPTRFWMNPETGGSITKETFVMRSTDGGHGWSDPVVTQLPTPPEGIEPAVGGPVIELDDGRWMLLFETWKAYENWGPMDIETYVLFSRDKGRTWTDWTTIADGRSYDRSFSHGHIIQLANKRLFALYWAGNAQFSEFHDLHWNTADAAGKQWTVPRTTGIHGQSCYPAEPSPGRITFIYSCREKTDQPGIKVVMSEDGGETWDVDNQVVAWDAYGKEALGVPRTDTYPTSHDVIAYGAPHLVRLSENELMASFWCTQSADTHIRFCRIRVEKERPSRLSTVTTVEKPSRTLELSGKALLYEETFDIGTGDWTAGKDKSDGSFNINVLGQRGEALPLGWVATGGPSGGFVYSESPWYFDSNHGQFMWFYMPLIGPLAEKWAAHAGANLRDALVRLTLRGQNVVLRGTKLYLWVQGHRGPNVVRAIYNPGDPLVNWALTSQAISTELLDGEWHHVELVLHNDEDQWSQMGLLNRGLPRKIVIEQSLSAATGTLDHLLNGHHHNFGFVLGGVDPNDVPSGRIELDRVSIWSGRRQI